MEAPPNLNATAQPIESNENKNELPGGTLVPGSSFAVLPLLGAAELPPKNSKK